MSLLINLIGILFILFVVYWFWLAKRQQSSVSSLGIVEIKVAGGVYSPAIIEAKIHQPITLRFIRMDESPCASTVIFADLNKSAELPLHTPVDLTLIPDKVGEFAFTCQMGMYRGRLIIKA